MNTIEKIPNQEYNIRKKFNFIPKAISSIVFGMLLVLSIVFITRQFSSGNKDKSSFTTLNKTPSEKLLSTEGIEIKFSIAIKQRNIHLLSNILLDISNPKSTNYGNYYSIKKIQELTAPKLEDINRVLFWLKDNNIKNIKNNLDSIICISDISYIEKLFEIKYTQYNNSLVPDKDYKIPNDLSEIIEFVEGVTIIKVKNNLKKYNNHIDVDSGLASREVIQRLYNVIEDTDVNNQSICSVEYQGRSNFNQSNLLESQRLNNITEKPIIDIINQENKLKSDMESNLDVQMISQTAENVNILYWNSENWLFTFATELFNIQIPPDVVSISWGGSEKDQCSTETCTKTNSSKYINRINIEYIKINLRGVSIVVSSGDSGASNTLYCNDDSPLNPSFPGSSPWVTSVGATFLKKSIVKYKYETPMCKKYDCAMGIQEVAANFNYIGWTTGGGFSNFNRFKWQDKVVNKYLKSGVQLPSKFNIKGRAFPDVSTIGHSCPVYNNGVTKIDGTSCSAPLFAAFISILNQHQIKRNKPKLGFFNPILYLMAEDNPMIFNDVIIGNNSCTETMCCSFDYGYQATTGYDPVTGLGTPNVKKMIIWLDNNT